MENDPNKTIITPVDPGRQTLARSTAAPQAVTQVRSPIGQKAVAIASGLSTGIQKNVVAPITKTMASNGIAFTPAQKLRATGVSQSRSDVAGVKSLIDSNNAQSLQQPAVPPRATALPGYRSSLDPGMTQLVKPITAEDLSRPIPPTHADQQRMQQNRAAGTMHVSPDGVVEPPAGSVHRTGQPAPKDPFGGKNQRMYNDPSIPQSSRPPLSAEAASWQQQQAAQKPFEAINNTQQQAVNAAQSSEKGAMRTALEKGKSYGRSVVGAAKSLAVNPAAGFGAGVALAGGLVDASDTTTDQYAERLGLGKTAAGQSLLQDAAIRTGGVASDVVANIPIVGEAVKQGLYRDQQGNGNIERTDKAVKDGTSELSGTALAAAAFKGAQKLPGKFGKAARFLAPLAGYAAGSEGADFLTDNGRWHVDNESKPLSKGSEGGAEGLAGDGESQKIGQSFDPGYMKEGSTLKQGVFNESTVDMDKLNERANQNSLLSMPSGSSLPSGITQQVADHQPQQSGSGMHIIRDSSTEKRNAEVSMREMAGNMEKMTPNQRNNATSLMLGMAERQQDAAYKEGQLGLGAQDNAKDQALAAQSIQTQQIENSKKLYEQSQSAQLDSLRKSLAVEQDPAKRAELEKQLGYMTPGGANRYKPIQNMDGSISVFDSMTGQPREGYSLAMM